MEKRYDEKLVHDYIAGEETALETLIKRYLKHIYSFVCRYVGNGKDAEDITQEVFLRMWKNIKKFDTQKKFKTWLFNIAKNASIDFLKKKRDIPFSFFENETGRNVLIENIKDSAALPTELMQRADTANLLNAAMKKLSPEHRMVLFLRYNDHFNFREIGESLGESLHTIKSRHRRALIMLKKLLGRA